MIKKINGYIQATIALILIIWSLIIFSYGPLPWYNQIFYGFVVIAAIEMIVTGIMNIMAG